MFPIYHHNPAHLSHDTEVLEYDGPRIRVASSPFYPGGGGQPADRGTATVGGRSTEIAEIGIGHSPWLTLAEDLGAEREVTLDVDPDFRRLMSELHTATHILNALVFRDFDGALVTGAQLAGDGTARLDFDLPGADNDRLRALEGAIAEVRRQALPVRALYVDRAEAEAEPGLIRSKSVAPPPTEDGMIRVIEIAGLDRQACGGTHVTDTGAIRPVRVLKVENTGRQNRRIRIGLMS